MHYRNLISHVKPKYDHYITSSNSPLSAYDLLDFLKDILAFSVKWSIDEVGVKAGGSWVMGIVRGAQQHHLERDPNILSVQ